MHLCIYVCMIMMTTAEWFPLLPIVPIGGTTHWILITIMIIITIIITIIINIMHYHQQHQDLALQYHQRHHA